MCWSRVCRDERWVLQGALLQFKARQTPTFPLPGCQSWRVDSSVTSQLHYHAWWYPRDAALRMCRADLSSDLSLCCHVGWAGLSVAHYFISLRPLAARRGNLLLWVERGLSRQSAPQILSPARGNAMLLCRHGREWREADRDQEEAGERRARKQCTSAGFLHALVCRAQETWASMAMV